MDVEEVRRLALSLPEATEEPHLDMSSFRVRGKIFATLTPDHAHLNVFVDEHEARATVGEDPDVFAEVWWGKQLRGVRVAVAGIAPGRLRELVESAWRRRAPARVVSAYDAAHIPGQT